MSRCQPPRFSSAATNSAVLASPKLRQRRLDKTIGHHAIDPAPIATAGQIEMLLDLGRKRGGMLDHLAINVDDVERAVGSVGELGRPEPDVVRSDEFAPLVDPPGDHGRSRRRTSALRWTRLPPTSPMNAWLPHFGRKCVAAVTGHAGGPGEIAGGPPAPFDAAQCRVGDPQAGADDPPRLDGAGAKDFGRRGRRPRCSAAPAAAANSGLRAM